MLKKALEREVAQYIDEHRDEVNEEGRRLVFRNGRAESGKVNRCRSPLSSRALVVHAALEPQAYLPRTSHEQDLAMRRSPKVAEVLPILYLRGLSTGDVREALPVLLDGIQQKREANEDEDRKDAARSCRFLIHNY